MRHHRALPGIKYPPTVPVLPGDIVSFAKTLQGVRVSLRVDAAKAILRRASNSEACPSFAAACAAIRSDIGEPEPESPDDWGDPDFLQCAIVGLIALADQAEATRRHKGRRP